ncbi:MAG: DUF222 domain-containing protein [Lacisediminihabitans sp.]
MENFASRLLETATAISMFAAGAEDFDELSDERLLELERAIAACDRSLDAYRSHAAKQLARRSKRELGHAGLAARHGFASPEAMIENVSQVSGRQAVRLVAIGRLMEETDAARNLLANTGEASDMPAAVVWEAPIIDAIESGELSVECADALRRGLGSPTEQINAEVLRGLAERVLAAKGRLSADKLYKAARTERNLADLTGIKAQQEEMYARGGLRLFPQADGMWRLTADLDPEAAAELTSVLDPLTSPRRGGPRFIDPHDVARARRIVDDPRTTERIALDGLLELLRLGVNADQGRLHGAVRPVVKIVVTQEGLDTGSGLAIIENNGEVVSIETAERALCSGDSIEVTVAADGSPLDLGHTVRLFSRRQREALAVRDGGCMWTDCTKPPSWTEAHHVEHWKRDHGKTDVRDGLLLCKYHHLELHNNHWEIERRGSEFWLIPPPTIDSACTPVLLQSKSVLMTDLRRKNAG